MGLSLHVPPPDLYIEDVGTLIGICEVFQHDELVGLVPDLIPGSQMAKPLSFMMVADD